MRNIIEKLKSREGIIILSIIWGLGLASIFRKVCIGRNCIVYRAPSPKKMINNVYLHDGKCYKYTTYTTKCTNDYID